MSPSSLLIALIRSLLTGHFDFSQSLCLNARFLIVDISIFHIDLFTNILEFRPTFNTAKIKLNGSVYLIALTAHEARLNDYCERA